MTGLKNIVKKNNLGLSLLRMFMSFCVVLIHYWNETDYSRLLNIFKNYSGYAVPVFMTMSFYFTQRGFLKRDKEYIKTRLWRLMWPQIG